VTQDKTPEKPAEDEDNVLASLSKIYNPEGAVSSQLTNLVDKWSKRCCLRTTLKKSRGNTTDLRIVKVSTRVSPEICPKMKSSSKSRDLKIHKIESSSRACIQSLV